MRVGAGPWDRPEIGRFKYTSRYPTATRERKHIAAARHTVVKTKRAVATLARTLRNTQDQALLWHSPTRILKETFVCLREGP